MRLLRLILSDLGTYVTAMAVFGAIVCYRANPLRAVNRYMSALLATYAFWQTGVVLARTTHNVELWGSIIMPTGAAAYFIIFLLHDACVDPHAPLRVRLVRNRLAWLSLVAYAIGWSLAIARNRAPSLFPFSMRIIAAALLVLASLETRKQRRMARSVNPDEIRLFFVAATHWTVVLVVFYLDRGPSSSRINTLLTLIFLSVVLGLLLSERVLYAGDAARGTLSHVLRWAVQVLALLPIVALIAFVPVNPEARSWLLVGVIAAAIYPIDALSRWIERRILRVKEAASEKPLREAAMEILGRVESESELRQEVEALARTYLRGLDVTLALQDATRGHTEGPADLLRKVGARWLSPDSAVRQFRGPELAEVLQGFATAKLGAVVKYTGRQVVAVMWVAERSGGAHPISGRELNFLYELATVAGCGADRLRAVDDNFRSHGLAFVGQLAADLSHRARTQIAAIQSLVETVKDGQEQRLSSAERRSVHEQTLALAASYNLTLEITRLHPRPHALCPVSVAAVLKGVVSTYTRMAVPAQRELEVTIADRRLAVLTDERLLRQVVLILIRNSMEACASAGVTMAFTILAWSDGDRVRMDLKDNGPGLPADVFDRLHSSAPASATDTVGLGLTFCAQALRSIGAELNYLRPRGQAQAWFRIDLTRAESDAATGLSAAVPTA